MKHLIRGVDLLKLCNFLDSYLGQLQRRKFSIRFHLKERGRRWGWGWGNWKPFLYVSASLSNPVFRGLEEGLIKLPSDHKNCETQPPASIGWVALSSLIVVRRLSFVPHPWHLFSSPLYDVSDHTNHIFSVRIWPWQHVIVIHSWVKPSLLLSSLLSTLTFWDLPWRECWSKAYFFLECISKFLSFFLNNPVYFSLGCKI